MPRFCLNLLELSIMLYVSGVKLMNIFLDRRPAAKLPHVNKEFEERIGIVSDLNAA